MLKLKIQNYNWSKRYIFVVYISYKLLVIITIGKIRKIIAKKALYDLKCESLIAEVWRSK